MPPIEAKALGVVEVVGLSFAVAAADAMVKTAPVQIVSEGRAGGGLVSIVISGDIASVRAAVDAGAREVATLGGTATTSVIGRPEPDVVGMLATPDETPTADADQTPTTSAAPRATRVAKKTTKRPAPQSAPKRPRRGSTPS